MVIIIAHLPLPMAMVISLLQVLPTLQIGLFLEEEVMVEVYAEEANGTTMAGSSVLPATETG